MSGEMPIISATRWVQVIPTTETSALDAGDVVFDRKIVPNCVGGYDRTGWLMSVTVVDATDQKAALELVFLKADVTLGTIDAAPSISDANALHVLGVVHVPASAYDVSTNPHGWVDLGGVSTCTITGINLPITPVATTADIYVAAFTPGTPTYAAATAITLNLGFAD
jgi:hypothetical protein